MKLSAEISMYPLADDYVPQIKEFIGRLNAGNNVEVKTNSMSTQVFGEYDDVMSLLQRAVRESFETWGKCIFVTKFLPGDSRESTGYE